MIVIFCHDIRQILSKILLHLCCIIILRLMDIPHIDIFVHNKHPHIVACIEHCFRTWIMGTAYRIITVLFQNTDFSSLSEIICTGPEQSVIVMDAGSP